MEPLQKIAAVIKLIDDLKNSGSWCGETHIQKAIYFLQEMTYVETSFDYILYKHGPYSFDLHDELISMQADGLLEIVPQGQYGPTWHITEAGRKLLSPDGDLLTRETSFVANQFGNKAVAELERLGTALYIRVNSDHTDSASWAKNLCTLKPHVSADKALTAVESVEKMFKSWQSAR